MGEIKEIWTIEKEVKGGVHIETFRETKAEAEEECEARNRLTVIPYWTTKQIFVPINQEEV